MQTIKHLIESNIETLILMLALFGLVAIAILGGLFTLILAEKAYNKILRVWTPKGWYFSMVVLISDMARGAKWQDLHAAKVLALMSGLRKENYPLFCRLFKGMESIKNDGALPRPPVRPSAN